jgi:hypothetical protein
MLATSLLDADASAGAHVITSVGLHHSHHSRATSLGAYCSYRLDLPTATALIVVVVVGNPLIVAIVVIGCERLETQALGKYQVSHQIVALA